jgi:hypothetical protein
MDSDLLRFKNQKHAAQPLRVGISQPGGAVDIFALEMLAANTLSHRAFARAVGIAHTTLCITSRSGPFAPTPRTKNSTTPQLNA